MLFNNRANKIVKALEMMGYSVHEQPYLGEYMVQMRLASGVGFMVVLRGEELNEPYIVERIVYRFNGLISGRLELKDEFNI